MKPLPLILHTSEVFENKERGIKYEIIKFNNDECIKFRGAQIESPKIFKKKAFTWRFGKDDEEEKGKYCKFIIFDWKNKRLLKDYSINPKKFANYFQQSNLPFETSPIFFKAEVLDKYKNNPDKYDLSKKHQLIVKVVGI